MVGNQLSPDVFCHLADVMTSFLQAVNCGRSLGSMNCSRNSAVGMMLGNLVAASVAGVELIVSGLRTIRDFRISSLIGNRCLI